MRVLLVYGLMHDYSYTYASLKTKKTGFLLFIYSEKTSPFYSPEDIIQM